MTLFEYVAVAASLLCSFSAVRLLAGFSAAFRPDRRYWVHSVFVVQGVVMISMNWWLFWGLRDVDWSYPRFLVALLPLAVVYVQATLLVPADPGLVRSWRDHYFQIRSRFFSLGVAYVVSLTLVTVVLLHHPLLHPRRAFPAAFIGMQAAGALSGDVRLHAGLAIGTVLLTGVALVLSSEPGALALIER